MVKCITEARNLADMQLPVLDTVLPGKASLTSAKSLLDSPHFLQHPLWVSGICYESGYFYSIILQDCHFLVISHSGRLKITKWQNVVYKSWHLPVLGTWKLFTMSMAKTESVRRKVLITNTLVVKSELLERWWCHEQNGECRKMYLAETGESFQAC